MATIVRVWISSALELSPEILKLLQARSWQIESAVIVILPVDEVEAEILPRFSFVLISASLTILP